MLKWIRDFVRPVPFPFTVVFPVAVQSIMIRGISTIVISQTENLEKYPLGAAFLEPIVQVLHAMNIPVEVGQRKDLWLPGHQKISGTASHVGRDRELHHGTLLYDANLENLQLALSSKSPETNTRAIPSVPSPVKNIRTWLSEKGLEAPVSEHFFSLLQKQLLDYHQQDSSFRLSESETVQIEKLFVSKYESKDWNFRK